MEAEALLDERYPNSSFDYSDAGSKMETAKESGRILEMLLAAMAVIVLVMEYRPILPMLLNLLGDEGQFCLGQFAQVQLVAKASRQGHPASGDKGSYTAISVAGTSCHMSTHCGIGVDQGHPLLDGQPVDGLGVVRCPYLWAVIEHTWVKSSAPRAAVFQQYPRELRY